MLKIKYVAVEAPVIDIEKSELMGGILLNFYRDLGWNGEDFLDPSKIRTTKAVFDSLLNAMHEKQPKCECAIGMLMCNSGPGVDENIPANTVHLLEGWVHPDTGED